MMDLLNYEVLKKTGYDGYILEKAPEKVMAIFCGLLWTAFSTSPMKKPASTAR